MLTILYNREFTIFYIWKGRPEDFAVERRKFFSFKTRFRAGLFLCAMHMTMPQTAGSRFDRGRILPGRILRLIQDGIKGAGFSPA